MITTLLCTTLARRFHNMACRRLSRLTPRPPLVRARGLSEGDMATIRRLYDQPETGCEVSLTGYLSRAGDLAFIPANDYASSPAGVHEGHLTGPSNADVNLPLLYWTGTSWGPVAESSGATSDEFISYSGPSGYYLWITQSDEGSGSYTFCLNRP